MELQNKYRKKGLVVVSVSFDEGSSNKVKAWAKARKASQIVLHDANGKGLSDAYGVKFFPTHVLIDRKGVVVKRSTEEDPLSLDEIQRDLPGLLKK